MSAPILTQDILRSLVRYEPETGEFFWLTRNAVTRAQRAWNTRYAGKRAGYDWTPTGSRVTYRCLRIFDWPFLGHRLAWLYMTGNWPVELVDHRDCDGLNNRWKNLRAANRSQNSANMRVPCTSSTGHKGVTFDKVQGRYRAYIKYPDRQKHLGYFDTPEEASEVVRTAARKRDGEFARHA